MKLPRWVRWDSDIWQRICAMDSEAGPQSTIEIEIHYDDNAKPAAIHVKSVRKQRFRLTTMDS